MASTEEKSVQFNYASAATSKKKNVSDADSDIEHVNPLLDPKHTKMQKCLIGLLLLGLAGTAIAIPAVMLTRKPPPKKVAELTENEVISYNFPFTTRAEWGARKPKEILPLNTPVPYVVIHHSFSPPACYNRRDCVAAMKGMQDFHMDDRRWWDIGYNFGVGSDGVTYEGRGWPILGAHSLHFNNVSIGICVIGDWTNSVPPAEQLKTVKSLIVAGVELGYIKSDYKLVGHRQVRATDCPGQAFFNHIKTWEHWVPFPASHEDLVKVPEMSEEFKTEYRKKLNLTRTD